MKKIDSAACVQRVLEAPFGPLLAVACAGSLRELRFGVPGRAFDIPSTWRAAPASEPVLERLAQQLERYYAGELREFELPLEPLGTDFQLRVWSELRRIPWGRTISYGELATRIGQPSASRAVGAANGKNPLPIVIPCHRVIGSDGSLTGFGGGLPIKRALLAIEGSSDELPFH